ncbi:MAG: type II toxin-antitoxin system RnlA family toxin [Selenomonadaceae bacterium]|nr:type II toxin-antitoxin system RnlA family toxin [Selenomonadaceae bacterium]
MALEEGKYVAIEGDSWFSISNFNDDILNKLIDVIKEIDENIKLSQKYYPDKKILYFSLDKNKIIITYFSAKNHKLLVQGKMSILSQIVVSAISECIDIKFEHVLGSAYRKSIDANIINNDYKVIFPKFPDNYPDSKKNLLGNQLLI